MAASYAMLGNLDLVFKMVVSQWRIQGVGRRSRAKKKKKKRQAVTVCYMGFSSQ